MRTATLRNPAPKPAAPAMIPAHSVRLVLAVCVQFRAFRAPYQAAAWSDPARRLSFFC